MCLSQSAGRFLLLALSLACNVSCQNASSRSEPDKNGNDYIAMKMELEMLRKTVAELSRQVMMQQFFVEEKVRTEGNSGVTLIRGGKQGLRNYASNSHVSSAAFSIHDHSNYINTLGFGEFGAVMNGFHFRTRHNDYKLVMPSRHSREYHAVEDIPFPDVPPEVIKKSTVEEQITEMREWFKAFHKQDRSIRDYTKYFKPNLCYMEGAWTLDEQIVEPFQSDRHSLDASSWAELLNRIRYTSLTGVKSRLENLAFLPTTITSVNMTTGEIYFAQWNYRMLCSPVNFDIPLAHFHQEDDLVARVRTGQTMAETAATRVARFKLFDTARSDNYQLLDQIFASIPGMDNHGGNLSFTVFGDTMLDSSHTDQNVLLNTAYYHRSYRSDAPGAMGSKYAAFGFNDDNMWTAQTTQERVAPFLADECTFVRRYHRECHDTQIRVSYAIPMEIVYTTPLLSWNPYNLTFHNDTQTSVRDGRNGRSDAAALDGIDKIHYYMTPAEFYSGPLDKTDPADTVKAYIRVRDQNGQVRKVSASGTSVVLPEIEGVGKIRLRYPIAPVHEEGSSVWKELNALKDYVLESSGGVNTSVAFQMSVAVDDPPGEHTHDFTITYHEFSELLAGRRINLTTDEAQGHSHHLTIIYVQKKKKFKYIKCDNSRFCDDGHPPPVTLETKNVYTNPH
ncbi:hypothetical protein BsWGS_14271 [Bradybaena similaris]